MSRDDFAIFDTDMQIHRLCEEPGVGPVAERMRTDRHPVRTVGFSKVEFKNAYVQRLVLLHNKVRDSDSFAELFSRARNTGGRGAEMMLAQLIRCLGRGLLSSPWTEAKAILLTHLDAQVGEAWRWFDASVDGAVDEARCTRATEGPSRLGTGWDVRIPDCRKNNTRCRITQLFKSNHAALQSIVSTIGALPPAEVTTELQRIRDLCTSVLSTGTFPWEGTTCRGVGDLLVALEAKNCRVLVTSNKKEHVALSQAVGYPLDVFPYAQLRLK